VRRIACRGAARISMPGGGARIGHLVAWGGKPAGAGPGNRGR
jgi:hypothetical protein